MVTAKHSERGARHWVTDSVRYPPPSRTSSRRDSAALSNDPSISSSQRFLRQSQLRLWLRQSPSGYCPLSAVSRDQRQYATAWFLRAASMTDRHLKLRHRHTMTRPSTATNLSTLVTWQDSPLPPSGTHTLVTDTIGSPATFLLVHFLKSALTATSPRRVTWVSCDTAGFNHLASISRRAGVSLTAMQAKGLFHWVDAGSVLLQARDGLKDVFSRIKAHIDEGALVIVDDLSSLAWALDAGGEVVARWIVALRALCVEYNAPLVTLLHTAPETSQFMRIYRTASTWIQVNELASGKARDCSGQVCVHVLGGGERVVSPALGRSKAMLFNIANDGGVSVWARGMQV